MNNNKLANGQFLRITELYAFIAKDKDGHEGIMGLKTPKGWIPMIGADLERVSDLMPIAQKESKKYGVEFELRYFTSHGDVAPSLYNKEG